MYMYLQLHLLEKSYNELTKVPVWTYHKGSHCRKNYELHQKISNLKDFSLFMKMGQSWFELKLQMQMNQSTILQDIYFS